MPSDTNRLPPGKKVVYISIATIAGLVLLIGLTECVLRVTGRGYDPRFFRAIPNQDAVTGNPYFGWRYFGKSAETRTGGLLSISTSKPGRTYRIFVLGASAALGDPNLLAGFSRFLRSMLRETYPEWTFEVHNLALTAINSHVVRDIAAEAAAYQPDLFVVYLGNNEVVGPFGPGSVFEGVAGRMAAIRFITWFRGLRTGQLINDLFSTDRADRGWRGMAMFLGKTIAADDGRLQRTYRQFEQNLVAVCEAAERAGAKVALCTVAVNLRDCPPFAPLADVPQTPARQEAIQSMFARADTLVSENNFNGAAAVYELLIAEDGGNAELHYLLGRCHLKSGDYSRALDAFGRARNLDGLRFRADDTINTTVRRTAQRLAGGGVFLVDVARKFESISQGGVVGTNLFLEHVHLNPFGNYMLAGTVFEATIPKIPENIAITNPHPAVPSRERCERLIGLTLHEEMNIYNSIVKSLEREPFTNQLDNDLRLQTYRKRAESLEKSVDANSRATLDGYQYALSHNGDDLDLRLVYGTRLLSFGKRCEALEIFQDIDRRVPGNRAITFSMGKAHYVMGDRTHGVALFDKSISMTPNKVASMMAICRFFLSVNEFDRAKAYADRAYAVQPNEQSVLSMLVTLANATQDDDELHRYLHELEPLIEDNPTTRLKILESLSSLYERRDELKRAMDYSLRAIELEPDVARFRQRFAWQLHAAGQEAEAKQQYQLAFQLDPDNGAVAGQYFDFLLQTGDDIKALELCLEMRGHHPESLRILNSLAMLRSSSSNPMVRDADSGLALAEELNALASDPTVRYLHTLAVARMEANQIGGAFEAATQAVALAKQEGNQQYIRILEELIDSRNGPAPSVGKD